MIRTFPIEFIRQALVQTLFEEKQKNPNFFGGDNEIQLTSLYEQLKSQGEVDRFTERFRDLTDQQNRMNLIANGMLLAPENPSITNLYSSTIIPMSFNCFFRVQLANRDPMIETINNLIETLKGRKVDIAQLETKDEFNRTIYVPFCVGTIGEELDDNNEIALVNGMFLGIYQTGTYLNPINFSNSVNSLITNLRNKGIDVDNLEVGQWFYVQRNANDGDLKVAYLADKQYDDVLQRWEYSWQKLDDDSEHEDILFPPEHSSAERFKLSMSFDSVRSDTPRTITGDDYCELSFSGSATLVNSGVALGNDLIRIGFKKYGIRGAGSGSADVVFNNPTRTWLEPLEMPSGSNANTNPVQLLTNKMVNNTHTDGLSLTLQYTFIADKNVPLIKQWFNYARYGTQGITESDISPNLVYEIEEIICEWGEYEINTVKAKVVENIDIENTESDTLTLSLTFQIQGVNN